MMRQRVLSGAALFLGLVVAACAHNPEPRAGADSAPADSAANVSGTQSTRQEVELTGKVLNSGTDRFTVTTLEVADAPSTTLTGELLDELRTLAGAQVRVRGVVDSAGAWRSLDVREYEVLAINGKRPHVGIVLLREGSVWLAASDTLQLVPALDALRDRTGAKIWVVGSSDAGGTELRIESYGVIAPAR
jgi:hypothetical protein